MQHVGAHGDGGAMEHRVHVDRAVIAHVFAVRPFRLDVAALVEITLERHFGVGRHQNIVGEALDHRRRRGAELRHERKLVAAQPRRRGEEIERMRAGGERHRQFLAARDARGIDALEIGRRGDVDAAFGAVAQAQSPAADIAPPRRRIDGVIDRRAQIARAVERMLRMERQLGEVDILAGDLDRVHRRIRRWHFDERLRIGEPARNIRRKAWPRWSRRRRQAACDCRRSWRPARPVRGPLS